MAVTMATFQNWTTPISFYPSVQKHVTYLGWGDTLFALIDCEGMGLVDIPYWYACEQAVEITRFLAHSAARHTAVFLYFPSDLHCPVVMPWDTIEGAYKWVKYVEKIRDTKEFLTFMPCEFCFRAFMCEYRTARSNDTCYFMSDGFVEMYTVCDACR